MSNKGTSNSYSNNGEFGIVYLAFGRAYLAMALVSLSSLRSINPEIPACIITNVRETPADHPNWDSEKDHWIFIDHPTRGNRLFKTSVIQYTPFKKTLFLDCDTLILSDISRAAFFLDHFDILIKGSWGGGIDKNRKLFNETISLKELPHWNSGVIGFVKNPKLDDFFSLWNKNFKKMGHKRDQPSMVEAVFQSECRVLSLEGRWNSGDRLFDKSDLRDAAKIWHYKIDVDKKMGNRILSADSWIGESAENLDGLTTVEYLFKVRKLKSQKFFKYFLRNTLKKFRGSLPERTKNYARV